MRSPNLLRLDQIGPRDTYVLYFDGGLDSGWEILPDLKNPEKFRTTGKPIELVGGELRFARGYLSGFQFNLAGGPLPRKHDNVTRPERLANWHCGHHARSHYRIATQNGWRLVGRPQPSRFSGNALFRMDRGRRSPFSDTAGQLSQRCEIGRGEDRNHPREHRSYASETRSKAL